MIQELQVIQEPGVRREDPAYRNGWQDGRFGPTRLFLENPNLAGWEGPQERLAYYRGHRDGRRVREMLAHKPDTGLQSSFRRHSSERCVGDEFLEATRQHSGG